MTKLSKNQLAYHKLLKNHSKADVAAMAEVSRQALTKWDAIPPNRVLMIALKTGIPAEELLPDPCEDCQNPFCPKNQT
jgi:hypothetical protein